MRKLCIEWKRKCQIYSKMLRIRRVKIKENKKEDKKIERMILRQKVVERWRGKREGEFGKLIIKIMV